MASRTGRTRHRVATIGRLWWKRQVLILQVEATAREAVYDAGWVEFVTKTWWADARVQDITEEGNPTP